MNLIIFFVFIIPFYVQAIIKPPSSIFLENNSLHVEHLSVDQLKTTPAKPLVRPLKKPTQQYSTHINPVHQSLFPLLQDTVQTTVDESSINSCYEGFVTKTGETLIEHIRSSDKENCMYRLFSKAPKDIRLTAFRSQNMMDTAVKAQNLSLEYEGQGNDFLRKLFLFLRTGYYNNFYHEEEMDWSSLRPQIDRSVVSAVETFMNNPYYYNVNSEHGNVLFEVLTLTDNAEKQAYFLPRYIDYLNQVDERYEGKNNHNMRIAVNPIFNALFRGHQRPDFHSAVTNNREIINTLRNFALSDWAVHSDLNWLTANASLELSRFLQYDGQNVHYPRIAVYEHLTESVRSLVHRYRNDEEGVRIFISALKNILFFEKCREYNVCGLDQEIERQVLNTNYECSSLGASTKALIRAQNFTEEKLLDICNVIQEQDRDFHERFMTNQMPVQDDHNQVLEIIIFDTPDSYTLYSYLFFRNSTDNGGIYLEGDPSNPSNTARFIAYLADWLGDRPVWNLKHEYVHYLDGRFNLYGNFSDYKTQTHHTVWWAEGLAEYLSKKNKHQWAYELLQSEPHKFSDILQINYSDSAELIYPWSYLAVRFVFERYAHEVGYFLNYFKQGLYEDYKEYIESIGDRYNAEFVEWLDTLEGLGEENLNTPNRLWLFNRIMNNLESHQSIDLTNYIDIPENAKVSADSSHPETATALIVNEDTLIITPSHSLGSTIISITITTADDRKIIYEGQISVIQGFRFIPDRTVIAHGITYKYMTPSDLSICDKTRTINLLDYVEEPLLDTISFAVGINYSEDTVEAEIDGSLLTLTALKTGETEIWISLENEGYIVDEINVEMQITGDSDQCEEEEEEEGDDDDEETETECVWVPIGRIWIPICS